MTSHEKKSEINFSGRVQVFFEGHGDIFGTKNAREQRQRDTTVDVITSDFHVDIHKSEARARANIK